MTSDTVLLESCHDKTLVEARITYNSHDNSSIVPAIVLAHPYGPLGMETVLFTRCPLTTNISSLLLF